MNGEHTILALKVAGCSINEHKEWEIKTMSLNQHNLNAERVCEFSFFTDGNKFAFLLEFPQLL